MEIKIYDHEGQELSDPRAAVDPSRNYIFRLPQSPTLSLRLLWAFHGEVLGVAIRPCTLNLQDTLIHIQKTEAKKSGLLPEQVTVVVLVDELRKVPPCANEIDDTRRQLLNAITGAQYNFVISCRPIFFVVSCLELNAVYNVVSTICSRRIQTADTEQGNPQGSLREASLAEGSTGEVTTATPG